MAGNSLSYCAALIRQHDHDRYLTALLAPRDRREDLFALYAFNLEVARIAEVAREAALGEMRLQWWRETLAACETTQAPDHPVAEPLRGVVARHGLDRGCIDRLLDGRRQDLEVTPPVDLPALETYAEATSANLVVLALQVLGARTVPSEAAGRAIGIAWALTGLIRAVPFHARQRRLYLPSDLVAAEGLDIEALFGMRSSRPVQTIAAILADRARGHLRFARSLAAETTPAARPALALGILADRALRVLHGAGYDPFSAPVQGPDPSRAWRLAWANWRGRY